jgi:hypothetical protein
MSPYLNYIRIAARLSGTAISAFLLLMLLGHLTNPEDAKAIFSLRGRELFVFFLFPLSMVTGYVTAFWKELVGGLIVIAGQLLMYALQPALATSGLAWLVLPAVLYCYLGVMKRKSQS